MSIFALIFLGIPVLSLFWWAWAHWRFSKKQVHAGWHVALALGMAVILGGYVWVYLSRTGAISIPVDSQIYALVLLWGLLFLPLVALPSLVGSSLWTSLVNLKRFMVRPGLPSPSPVENAQQEAGMTRRQILGSLAIACPLLATYGTSLFTLRQIQEFRIRRITVPLAGLPAGLEGMTIAHLTDTHVGKFTHGPLLQKLADATTGLKADLILFTGDLIDNSIVDLPPALEMLRKIHGPGFFMIEGNHDLIDDGYAFRREVQAAGLPLLLDESASIQIRGVPVQILGIKWDRQEERMNLRIDHVAKMRRAGAFPILLAHHPHAFDRAAELGIPLTLAGHTHGGQLMVTDHIGAGPVLFRYWSGLYRKAASALVVSNGAGNWFPLRTHSPAEIIHLTLTREVA